MVAQSSDFVDVSDSLSGAERQPLLIILEALDLRSLSYVVGRMVAESSEFSDSSDFRKESTPHGC